MPWSMVKKIDHDDDILDFAHGQWSDLTHFDHLTMVILQFWWLKLLNTLSLEKILVVMCHPGARL